MALPCNTKLYIRGIYKPSTSRLVGSRNGQIHFSCSLLYCKDLYPMFLISSHSLFLFTAFTLSRKLSFCIMPVFHKWVKIMQINFLWDLTLFLLSRIHSIYCRPHLNCHSHHHSPTFTQTILHLMCYLYISTSVQCISLNWKLWFLVIMIWKNICYYD